MLPKEQTRCRHLSNPAQQRLGCLFEFRTFWSERKACVDSPPDKPGSRVDAIRRLGVQEAKGAQAPMAVAGARRLCLAPPCPVRGADPPRMTAPAHQNSYIVNLAAVAAPPEMTIQRWCARRRRRYGGAPEDAMSAFPLLNRPTFPKIPASMSPQFSPRLSLRLTGKRRLLNLPIC